MENNMKKLPYSYHTFLFPFIWKNKTNKINKETFEKVLTEKWVKKEFKDFLKNKNGYQARQYFVPNAQNLLYDCDGNGVVSNFVYQTEKNAQYIIEKNEEEFILTLHAIKMRVFESGVAILKIEAEYFGEKRIKGIVSEDKPTAEDFNKINEYGRRIYYPFIAEDMKNPLTADSLKLRFENKSIIEDFSFYYSDNADFSYTYISKTVMELLGEKFTSNKDKAKSSDKLYIYPIVDDRMFVCAMIRDSKLSDSFKLYSDEEKDYCIYSSEKQSQDIYKLAFIDVGEECSCQSKIMRKEILKRCVYDRWIDYGTIDIITHHSFMRVTSDADFIISSVVNPFLLQYIQMAEIALVQRATVLSLIDKIEDISAHINKNDVSNSEFYEMSSNLQGEYIKAQNQIFLGDVTVQEQGVEEFRMMLNELYIERTVAELDEQVKDVYEYVDGKMEKETNKAVNILTEISVLFAVAAIFIPGLSLERFFSEDYKTCIDCVEKILSVTGVILLFSGLGVWLSNKFIKK